MMWEHCQFSNNYQHNARVHPNGTVQEGKRIFNKQDMAEHKVIFYALLCCSARNIFSPSIWHRGTAGDRHRSSTNCTSCYFMLVSGLAILVRYSVLGVLTPQPSVVQLFTSVSKSVWEKRTFLIFYHLLDNYERATGVQENTSQRENKEQWDFLQACMQTRPMQYCFRYLVAKVRLL